MANKKNAGTTATTTISPEISNDVPTPTYHKVEVKVPSELWYCVEDATGLGTLALNLPSGCLIMAIVDRDQPAIQYVPGIHYDETNKRFSV